MAGIDLNALMGMIGSDGVQTIAKMTKTSGNKVTSVLNDALPVLVGKMSDNASTKAGAESLNKALNEHKTGEVIDAAAFLKSADSNDGKKILGHILGADEAAATKALSKKSGLSGNKVGTILSMVAPLLLTQLGNKKDDDSASGLGGLLGGLLGGNSSNNVGSTLLGGLLGSQSQSSGGLLGGLLGGNTQSQSSNSGLGGLLGGLFGGNQQQEQEEEEQSSGGLLGGLGNLAMGLFGDSEALSAKEETTSSGKKKTGKKTGTTSAKKKTGTTTSTGKKTAKKTSTTSSAKKTGTTSTGKKTAKKTGSK